LVFLDSTIKKELVESIKRDGVVIIWKDMKKEKQN
jgi:hypothetical protein